jgi:hypothetical protein
LLFVPDPAAPRLFSWGAKDGMLPAFANGRRDRLRCFTERQRFETVRGQSLPLLDALPHLAAITTSELEQLPGSVRVWSLAAKFALDLVARGRIVPTIETRAGDRHEARCNVSLTLPDDASRFEKLARAFPLAAHALAPDASGEAAQSAQNERVWAPDALLERFLNAAADVLARHAWRRRGPTDDLPSWEHRFLHALGSDEPSFTAQGFGERTLIDDLRNWTRHLAGTQRGVARVCFRLELPEDAGTDPGARTAPRFKLQFLLQAANDPSLLVDAAEVYRPHSAAVRRVARSERAAQEILLSGLAAAGRVFAPIQASLHQPKPQSIELTAAVAWDFLKTAAPHLIEAGLGVIVPSELTVSGQRRLRMRMRLGGARPKSPKSESGVLSLDEMMKFEWQAELAGEVMSEADLRELAQLKSPLVRYRGQWVAVEASEISEALRLLERRGGALAAHDAFAAALGVSERAEATTLPVEVAAEGSFAGVLERLRAAGATADVPTPKSLRGELRPYQLRGLSWLATMADLGLGACLADDMGLGKTVQLIALLLHRREHGHIERPTLLVCPTSVVGNWERELKRFAPSLPVVRHYGADRARDEAALQSIEGGSVLLTTYGLLRRDAKLLASIHWSVIALDEAQNIKTAASRTAQVARSLKGDVRIALTGTPVENRLAELWSIFEFLNPRLLGSQAAFHREYTIPIERYGQTEAAERLRNIVQPFILRRLKSDRSIIQDLPSKQEMKVVCSLTREQASLYQAALDAAMSKIGESEGIERRGLVLALITSLKQICNHPAQYLRESGPLAGRSGKLQRCIEMLEEVLAAGDRALVFTQYREMGVRLVAEIQRALGVNAPFLHGGVARAKRDEMVKRFQEDPHGPRIFVLSVKAGGTGLNLTGANHVFHYDRWWNPAVEDQATDRSYRIGQSRSVQVHKLLCAGTIEEKVDALLEEKRDLAARIVGTGEKWITELDDNALRDLFSLAPDAVVADSSDADDGAEPRRAELAGRIA